VLGLAVRLVAVLVVVDLVEEEDARVLRIAVRLVEAIARLGARRLEQLPNRFVDLLLLPFLRGPLRGDDVSHAQAPFVPTGLRRMPIPSISSSISSPGCSQRSSSRPEPPAAVPEPRSSPG